PQPPLQLSQSADASSGEINMFDKSLKFTNKVLSGVFGYSVRKVPPHMPHFINSEAMQQLQDSLLDEFEYRFAMVKVAKQTPVPEDSMNASVQRYLSLCVYNISTNSSDAVNDTEPLQWKSKPLNKLSSCPWLQQVAENATKKQPIFSYQLEDDSSVWFKMLTASFESTNSHLQE
uniref:Dynein_C domain-containing protein n=1 Tax=Macrostomum lignano TaxID=282301 RepID=A0A1I8IHS9_9PLAT